MLDLSAGVLIGFGLSGCSFTIVIGAFGKLLPAEWRSLAFGVGTAAGSFGQFLYSPIGVALMDKFGWQTALMIFAGGHDADPAVVDRAGDAARTGAASGGRGAAAVVPAGDGGSLRASQLRAAGARLFHLRLPARVHHRASAVLSASIADCPPKSAAGRLRPSACSTSSVRWRRAISATACRSATSCRSSISPARVSIVVFISLPASPVTTLIFGAVTGLLWLSTVPPTSALVAVMFGTRWLAMLFGFAFFSHQVGGFLGVWLGGFVFDTYGSYNPVWWLSMFFGVMSALINLPIVEKPVAHGAAAVARLTLAPAAERATNACGIEGSEARVATFKAIVIEKAESGTQAALTDFDEANLMDGDVTVRVEYSTVNYKDGLAVTGKAPVVRRFPMIAGIDFAGTVEILKPSCLEARRQGHSQRLGLRRDPSRRLRRKSRVKGDWLVRLPASMSAREAMAIGTAGYTAMLAVMALEAHGLTPASGPIAVTGAAGGVGSVAVAILAKRGFSVHAVTGRPQEAGYLKGLGAAEIVDAQGTGHACKAAGQGTLGGRRRCRRLDHARQPAFDDPLWRCGRRLRPCRRHGPAGVRSPPSFCAAVCLYGINSVMCPLAKRQEAWKRLETDLDRQKLAQITSEIPLSGVFDAAPRILAGQVRGRIVVKIG